MPRFLSQHIAQLLREFTYAPRARRRRQLDHAEDLYWDIDPDRNYPLDFVVYRITRYRPDTLPDIVLTGSAVRTDLLTLVEQLSATLDDKAADFDPPPLDLQALCKKLNVSTKTISRYRRNGLFARQLDFGNGRKRLGFLHRSVERFLDSRGGKAERARHFSRMDAGTRHAIIMRARRITRRVETTPFAVARHLSRRLGRSTEAIRQVLVAHDQRDPRVAIFPEHVPPLTEKQQRIIHRAYHRGVPVTKLAEHFGKARNGIYRAINRRRAAALKQLPIRCVHSPTFDLDDAEQVILESNLRSLPAAEVAPPGPPSDPVAADTLAAYLRQLHHHPMLDRETERTLFVRYNYLKYRASKLRDALDKYQPRAGDLDRIETYLRRAVAVKHQLVRSYLRLVVSVARKHLGSIDQMRADALAERIGEGNLVMLEAIETYDPGRGNRFSTYLTWALMKRFAADRSAAPPSVSLDRTIRREYWPITMDPGAAAAEHAQEVATTLTRLLGELDERERLIVTRHFGLADGDGQPVEPQTLAQVASTLRISAERARQIEHRAMLKLRRIARRIGIDRRSSEADGHGRNGLESAGKDAEQ